MKKFYLFALALPLLSACGGSGQQDKGDSAIEITNEVQVAEDSPKGMTDSQEEQGNQVVTSPQDTVTSAKETEKKEVKSEYASLISQAEAAAKKWDSNMKKDNWSTGEKYSRQCWKLLEKIEKNKSKLTPAEKKRFEKVYRRANYLADFWQ